MTSVAESKESIETLAVPIKIRDYAFPSSDPRFSGDGPYVPRANRPKVLARRLRLSTNSSGSTSPSSSSSEDVGYSQDGWGDEPGGWGGLKWGLENHWSTRALGLFPSQSELDRNFADTGDDDVEVEEEEEGFVDAEEDFSEQADDGMEVEPPLLPGIYRALYHFEPEGLAEMKLEEGQVVRVVGRGGGVGWAVVVKDGLQDEGVHALVPESYLEPWSLDCEEVDVWAGGRLTG